MHLIIHNKSDVDLKRIVKSLKGVVFDFDFTLADSTKGVVECVNYALEKLRFSKVANEEIYRTIGLTLEHTFIKLVGNDYLNRVETFKKLFIKRADEVMADLTILFDEAPYVIKKLYERSIKLGIVSTKFRYRIENILKRENLLNFFDVIVGGEDVSTHKPDPSGLKLSVKKLDLNSSEIVYIGDSITDAQTANNAEIPFIAVLSGVTSKKEFNEVKVDKFITNISELPKVLFTK
ncbi:MAG: HAD family hydrolase [Candidatus Hermodarchaeota archaeon]